MNQFIKKANSFINQYKTEILIVLVTFTIYFFLGTILTYYLQTYKFANVLFDLDTPRVFLDLTSRQASHYRTSVHPLFVICFQPFIWILKHILGNPEIAVLIIQSTFGSLGSLMIYLICNKIGLKKNKSLILTAIFSCMFNQIVFTASIETYIFAQFFLILLWAFTIYNIDKELNIWKYVFLTFLGVMSIAVTLTNFMHFIIALIVLILLNSKVDKKIVKFLSVLLCTFAIAVCLADAQLIVWHTSPNFFVKNAQDFRQHNSEEKLYIFKPTIKSVLKQSNSIFANSFNITNLKWTYNGYLSFKDNLFTNIISIVMMLGFFLFNGYYIYKTKFKIKKDKYYYALLLTFLGNFVFHLIYGNNISFIYTCHYNFLIILVVGYIIYKLKLHVFENKIFNIAFITTAFLLCIKNIVQMFYILSPRYNPVASISYLPIVITIIPLLLIALLLFKKKSFRIVSGILAIILIFVSHFALNYKKPVEIDPDDVFAKYDASLTVYKNQIKEIKNTYMVKNFLEPKESIGIFYFGMADRRKILYKEGKLIDIKTKEVIRDIPYTKELIVPNEYTVLLEDKDNNIYIIEENENGIFLTKNDEQETLVESGHEIKLPEFEGKTYSEILKVLHQEVLFNIDGSEPKPNLIGYPQAFYRDAMIATMVLEETGNVHLLDDWLYSIDSIYDYSRSTEIQETDNLGELLYMIGATGVDRQDLVDEIITEIERIRTEEFMISGFIDGFDQKYYPTAIALLGEKKLGISPSLVLNNVDDGYAKLTWYYDNPSLVWGEFINSRLYPYLGWAQLHATTYGTVYMLDEIYPLSYEAGEPTPGHKAEKYCFVSEFYCENNAHISHIWDASEKFLFMNEL